MDKVNDFDKIKAMLPKTALDLLELVGSDVTLAFIRAFGGCSFMLNNDGLRLADYVTIANAIGKENAFKIRQYVKARKASKGKGFCYFYVPKCDFLLKQGEPITPKPAFHYSEDIKPFLPAFALELLDILGGDAFERFIDKFGGVNFVFASRRSSKWRLKLMNAIGKEKADHLISLYKGMTIYIPTCNTAAKKKEQKAIILDYEAMIRGNSQAFVFQKLANKYNLSDRQVQNIVNSLAL